jgi:hypothetical protein
MLNRGISAIFLFNYILFHLISYRRTTSLSRWIFIGSLAFLLCMCSKSPEMSGLTDTQKFVGKWEIVSAPHGQYKKHTKTYFEDGTFTSLTTYKGKLPKAVVKGTWAINATSGTIEETYDLKNSSLEGLFANPEQSGTYEFDADGKLRLDFKSKAWFIYCKVK